MGSSGLNAKPVLLTIAGFDPSSGAGITADLKVFAAHGLYGMAGITALTVQSTQGVRSIEPVASATIQATLDTLSEDVSFAGVKIGMLASAEAVTAVTAFLLETGISRDRIVLDPVIRSSSGRELLSHDGLLALQRDLLPIVGWVTPNLDELAALTGLKVESPEAVESAAAVLKKQAENPDLNILVTGGHLGKPDDYLLSADGKGTWLPGERVETTSTHGTGCALSSALLCRLVMGDSPGEAARQAKAYVTSALTTAYPIGEGRGPLNHLFRFER